MAAYFTFPIESASHTVPYNQQRLPRCSLQSSAAGMYTIRGEHLPHSFPRCFTWPSQSSHAGGYAEPFLAHVPGGDVGSVTLWPSRVRYRSRIERWMA